MSEDKPKVDISSPEFKAGVEAGLNSTTATQNWQAGVELGQILKEEAVNKQAVTAPLFREPSTPLFLRDTPKGPREKAQDEKDETEE